MRILATRSRISGTRPLFEYRALIPFDEISPERQARISYRCDFARVGGLQARLSEVIAPMSWLAMPPGLEKHVQGLALRSAAKRIETLIVAAVFPEMTAALLPILFEATDDAGTTIRHIEIRDLAGAYPHCIEGSVIDAAMLGIAPSVRAAA